MQTNQHHRAIDKEADNNHAGHIHAWVARWVKPVHHGRNSYQRHKEHARCTTVTFEHLIRHPATQQGAGDPRIFIEEVGPGGFIQRKMLHLTQVGRRPVEDAVTQQIDKDVGYRDVPQQLVRQDILHEDLFSGQLLFVLFAVVIRIVVFVLFNRRQPLRLRRITHQRKGNDCHHNRTERRHIERGFPVVEPGHP